MLPANAETVLGDFEDASFTYGSVTSTFFRRGDEYWVRTDGPDGELTEYRIAYTFGAVPLQQYLIEFPGGRLQALSLCWDTRPVEAGGGRWFHLYPDDDVVHTDRLHWTGTDQNWNWMCAECHSTDLRRNYSHETDSYDTQWAEINVACEACHGPGSRHVAWARTREQGREPAAESNKGLVLDFPSNEESAWFFREGDPIARRSKPLPSRVEVETCGRCHSRRALIAADYVHGRPLADTHIVALLDEGLYHPDGQILDEVYVYGSFLQSKMYREGVTCSDCHEVHSAGLRARGNSLCGRCHLGAVYDVTEHHFHPIGSAGAECIGCHMPFRDYMVVDPRHDHSFRIPRPDLSVALGTPNACNDCHAEKSVAWSASAVARWYGEQPDRPLHYAEALAAGRAGRSGADRLLARIAADDASPAIARATALSLLGRRASPLAVDAARPALRDSSPLVRAGALMALGASDGATRVALALPLLNDPVRTVRLEAARLLAPVPLELLAENQRSSLDLGLAEYEQIQWANIDRVESNLNLGWVRSARGDPEGAERAYRRALRTEPSFIPAMVNLADLYRALGRDAEGEGLLREAVRVAPENADVHHALGLLLARGERTAEALDELELAARLRPESPRYAFVFAIALHSTGERARAIEILEEIHTRTPAEREPLIALASFAREVGDTETALRWAMKVLELAPGDPDTQAFVAELQQNSSD